MKKYFIIVFWKALEVSYKSFFWGRDCPDTLYSLLGYPKKNIEKRIDIWIIFAQLLYIDS